MHTKSVNTGNKRSKRCGMTLIEIMIVVALIVTITAFAGVGLGIIGSADVHGSALKFSSIMRYTFNMAATSNVTLQMKINLQENTFSVEKLDLSGGLSSAELRGETMKSSTSSNARRKSDDERAEKIDKEDSTFGVVTRTPVNDVLLTEEDSMLEHDVYFIGLITSHHDEEQTEGIGTINFFANGFVERSVIYIGDEAAKEGRDEGVIYTVTVNPLTGQSSVEYGKTEISSTFFEEEEDR